MEECNPPLGGGVGADDSSSGGGIPLPPVTDQEVVDAVRTAYFLDPDLPRDGFEVDSVQHVVYLRGMVPSLELKQKAESVAAQVDGVNRVVNQLRVTTS